LPNPSRETVPLKRILHKRRRGKEKGTRRERRALKENEMTNWVTGGWQAMFRILIRIRIDSTPLDPIDNVIAKNYRPDRQPFYAFVPT
jgi:hypothetical protein